MNRAAPRQTFCDRVVRVYARPQPDASHGRPDNFNPHCHAIISDGVWTAEGEFLELPSLDTAAVCELFRRLLLRRLHQQERLSERFMENLLSWVHPGFSVFAGEPLSPQDREQLERLARYITRPPLAADSIRRHAGLLEITTPPDPPTGSTQRLFDPLDWIHAVTAHIPDRSRHCVRYYGALANCARSSNLLSGPQNRVSLPNKVVTSAGLSRLSVAFEIKCPIVLPWWRRCAFCPRDIGQCGHGDAGVCHWP